MSVPWISSQRYAPCPPQIVLGLMLVALKLRILADEPPEDVDAITVPVPSVFARTNPTHAFSEPFCP